MKLDWSDHKSSDTGSRTVYFPGGFQLVVMNHSPTSWEVTKRWRVWWGGQGPAIKALTDRTFKTREDAMRAAETIFYPMVAIAPKLVGYAEPVISADRALAPKKPSRKRTR